jgi:hypothetical protein
MLSKCSKTKGSKKKKNVVSKLCKVEKVIQSTSHRQKTTFGTGATQGLSLKPQVTGMDHRSLAGCYIPRPFSPASEMNYCFKNRFILSTTPFNTQKGLRVEQFSSSNLKFKIK